MAKNNNNISFKGKTLKLIGSSVVEGGKAPDFKLVGPDLKDIRLADFKGTILVLSIVPSVDTSTCATQTKRFNLEIQSFGSEVALLTVSLDLPFAQAKFGQTEKCLRTLMASDYKYHSFGRDYGVYIEELGLLTRAVMVIDKSQIIRHVEYVSNISDEPDYAVVLALIKSIVKE